MAHPPPTDQPPQPVARNHRTGPDQPLPRITVVTPSLNQGAFLEETIRSVINQEYPDLEYIVIDGGSTDGSADIIRRYAGSLSYWVSEPDRGQAYAINKGWRRATGSILAWLNTDDTYRPGALAAVAAAYRRHPEAGLFCGDADVVDAAGHRLRTHHAGPVGFAEVLCWQPPLPQPAVFWSRRSLETAGWLDPELHYCMDYDLYLRTTCTSTVTTVPQILATMRQHAAAKTVRDPLAHVDEALAVLERFFERAQPSAIADLARQGRAALYLRRANILARQNQGAEARTWIARARQQHPPWAFRRRAAAILAKSWLGPRWSERLARLKPR